MTDLQLRPYQDSDKDGLIALIDGVYREYGDAVHLAGADADLLDIRASYLDSGGTFVVLSDGDVMGSHAVVPLEPEGKCCTFRRLYLAAHLRGSGWGERLMDWAFERAREQGFERVEFWSDTRFSRAHRFFQRLGFQPDGRTREMDDGLVPYSEFFFWRTL